ncbi:MAG: V-type ATPase subunit subunit G family protein [Nanoarchaeota archaeon]|nr:V-type ATPase subunit subunit G family protein [Nanoarchaeota archaeon]
MEAEILSEIRDSEKRADEIIERAKREKEAIVQDAIRNSSKLLFQKEDEIKKVQEKKLMDFREKAKLIKEEKLAEGKTTVKQIKAKAEKNITKAVEFVIKKFEEMV